MKYRAYTSRNISKIKQLSRLTPDQKLAIDVVSRVLPYKTNNYVVDELIDWENFENDPLYILNFPQKDMISEKSFEVLSKLVQENPKNNEISNLVECIRERMNPHPAGQLDHNVPTMNGDKLLGIQHKYRETLLFFPSQGQTCHAYCTFCFRWPQFTGNAEMKFAMKETKSLIKYLKENPEITDILITGGDPMVMKANRFESIIDKILEADLPQIKTIRIGTKSLSFWPYRYLTDDDTNDLLSVFRKISDKGIHLALMAHFNHYRELETIAVQEAVQKIRETGAQIRTQSPLLKHINDSDEVWASMWRKQVDMGMIPYYMFIARDTGAQDYFSVSMEDALDIFRNAYQQVSGICRTVRGPSMSAGPGKIQVVGISEIKGEKVFVLNFIQGRISDWINRPFFAKYDPEAMWLDDLKPALGENEFFYEKEYNRLLKINTLPGPRIKEDLQSA